jgi:hypothetical protein
VRQQDGKPSLMARLAAAPTSSGACEVPGRGRRPARYEHRLVPEQDAAITGPEPAVQSGPALDVREGIEFLSIRAPRREVSRT